jgi:hypothetical protein
VLGRLDNAAHPSGESGKRGPHRKNELHGDVWSAGGERRWGWRLGGGGQQLTVRGGRTQRRGARAVVESVEERMERAVHGGSVVTGIERGGAPVKGRRGAPVQGGARGGDGRAGWRP